METEVKDNWLNSLRALISYWIATLHQTCNPILAVPIIGDLWMDLLFHLSDFISPFQTSEGCINPIMVEVIRERMGMSKEEFNQKLKEAREDNERESVGLPPKHSHKGA